jgi:hypothetical protein
MEVASKSVGDSHPARRKITMRTRWLALAIVLALTSVARAGEPISLKVLYAGNPGSDREKDFRALLAEHFARVGTTDYRTFAEGQAKGYDVVILDWTTIYPRDEQGKIKSGPNMTIHSPTLPKLAESYMRSSRSP